MVPELLSSRLSKIAHGFKPFKEEACAILKSNSLADSKTIALELLSSKEYQIRCCGVFILGLIAEKDRLALHLLKEQACKDVSWQVQEIIAKAFDQFCENNGYEQSLVEIKEWLDDKNPNVCRAVTEGLRIWTNRPYFESHPQQAIALISMNKGAESKYLRMSVGNSLRDIHKKYPELIKNEISNWNVDDKYLAFTYKYVLKRH